jgi:hypothetical protein
MQLFQKLQHALPAPVLFGDGLHRLTEHDALWSAVLGGAEVATSAAVIVALLRAVRQLRTRVSHAPHAHSVDWIDIFLGVMVLVEATVHYHETGRLQRPTILLGAGMLVLGLTHGRLFDLAKRRRELRITDDGISVSQRFFRRFAVRWPEIAEIHVSAASAYVIARDGREHRFNFDDLTSPADVRHALSAAQSRWQTSLPSHTV